ncbi:OmpA family protein [Limnohabitans sp.]|uniref:OmpA family protein n=1 Tax=Limnohabitans sp. TaxID=1907725 RepID=UPI0037BEBBB2
MPNTADAVLFSPDTLEPFGASFSSARPAARDQAKIFIYRLGTEGGARPVNIYIDKRYHASILSGGYSEFCASPGQSSLLAVMDDAASMHTGKQAPGQNWPFQSGKTLFLKVEDRGLLSEVRADQALRELGSTAVQIHTISRSPLVQECKALLAPPMEVAAPAAPPVPLAAKPVAVAVKPPLPRLYALESDALFDFGKTQLRAKGYNEIESMAQKLRQDFSQVERIRVIGHSDPIGRPKTNLRLSLARAQVVADQLKERGIKPIRGFVMDGEGSRQLVKVNCGNTATPKNKLCHAPNRRVDIVVTGAKR